MAKRLGKAKETSGPDRSQLAMQVKAQKDKAGKNKDKKFGATPIY